MNIVEHTDRYARIALDWGELLTLVYGVKQLSRDELARLVPPAPPTEQDIAAVWTTFFRVADSICQAGGQMTITALIEITTPEESPDGA